MKANYDGIRYPIHKLKKDQTVLDVFTELAEVPLFSQSDGLPNGIDNDFVMRYIILMYANGSPAIKNYPHVGKRKTWVMKELGVFPDSKQHFPKEYNDILLNRNPLVMQKIAAFLTLQRPSNWQTWLKSEEQLYMLNSSPFPKDDKEANERVKLVNTLNEQVETHRQKVLEYDNEIATWQAVETFMAHTTLGLRPEEVVIRGLKPAKPHEAKASTIFPEAKS